MKLLKFILVFGLLGTSWLNCFAQQILFMDVTQQQPVANVELLVFHQNEQKMFVSNAMGIIKLIGNKQFDSVKTFHTSYESEVYSYNKLKESSFTIHLTPTTSLLPHIVIRGIPDDELLNDPQTKIDRIKPAEVQFQNPQTSADLVGMNGRLFVQKSQMGGGSPMIRGFAANNVLIVVDGVRMNNAIFREGNLQNIVTIDASLIDETEIFYGPGSVIYGSDALGGVLAFQTKTPSISEGQHYKGNVMLRTSTANKENSWHVDLEYGKNKVAGLSSISLANYSNLKMGSNGPESYTRPIFNEFNGKNDSIIINDDPNVQFFTGYSQINLNQKFRYKPNDKNDLILHFGYTTSSTINRYDRLIQQRNGQLRYGDWYYGPQKWAQFNARYKRTFSNSKVADKMVITAALQKFEESRHERALFSKQLDSRIEQVDAYTINADFDKKIGKLDVLYGAEGVYNLVNSEAFSMQIDSGRRSPLSTRYPNGSKWYNAGFYCSGRYELKPKTDLSAGLRYSIMGLNTPFSESQLSIPFEAMNMLNGAVNFNIGISQMIAKKQRLYANVSSGFRAPNVDDVGKVFDSEPGKIVVPNADLQPEYAFSAELGYTGEWNNKLEFSSNFYYTLIDNIVVRDNFSINGQDSLLYGGELLQIQSLVNASQGMVYGAEFRMSYRLNHFLKINSSYNLINGQTADNQPIRHVTPNFGTASVDFQYRRLKLQFYAVYNGELSYHKMAPTEQSKAYLYATDANGNPYSPNWYTINLKGGYFFSSSIKLNVGLENILNKRYRPYSSGISAPGRNLILSIYGRF